MTPGHDLRMSYFGSPTPQNGRDSCRHAEEWRGGIPTAGCGSRRSGRMQTNGGVGIAKFVMPYAQTMVTGTNRVVAIAGRVTPNALWKRI